MRVAVFCVGNKLMLDDGLGCAVYDELGAYDIPGNVDLYDVGCMSMDLLSAVNDYDLIVSVDALDETGEPAGTIFRFEPDDMKSRPFGTQSLHDLQLSDLFEAAALMGYEARGVCFGMQVQNASPSEFHMGLTELVKEKLPYLVDCVLATLVEEGIPVTVRKTGQKVEPGFHHTMVEDW